MGSLNTLTVQDAHWVALQLCGKVVEYSHDRLEEATYYQYGYGSSLNLEHQAARLLRGFRAMRPLRMGNKACAFACTWVFLALNGRLLDLDDEEAIAWLEAAWSGAEDPVKPLTDRLRPIEPAQGVAEAFREFESRFPCTLALLLKSEPPAPTL